MTSKILTDQRKPEWLCTKRRGVAQSGSSNLGSGKAGSEKAGSEKAGSEKAGSGKVRSADENSGYSSNETDAARYANF